MWDVTSGSLVRTLTGHTSGANCIDVSPDNARILSCSFDGNWKLWNSRTGELQHEFNSMHEKIYCCSFSPKGKLILVGCDSEQTHGLRLHNSTTYELQQAFTGHGDVVATCSLSPDGTTILSGSNDLTMKLWSTTTGQCLRTLDGHSGIVYACYFSPSGEDICSASFDGTLMMWTTATGQLGGIIGADDKGSTHSTCASSDGKIIVSGHTNGVVKMWRVGWGSSLK